MLCTIEKNFEPPEAMAGQGEGAGDWGQRIRQRNKMWDCALQGHNPLPLSGFLLETCEEAELLERETKTALQTQEPKADYTAEHKPGN